VRRVKTCSINRAVQKCFSEQFGLFCRFLRNVKKMSILREF
jgi:hypothetical protein